MPRISPANSYPAWAARALNQSQRLPLLATSVRTNLNPEGRALRASDHLRAPMNNIEERVITAVSQALLVDRSRVVPSASLFEDLHGDSLNSIEMIMILEEDFGIEISDEDAEAITTVQQAIDYVTSRVRRSP